MHVAVLGAGIIGLSTALELQSEFRNIKVTIISDGFEAETTSAVAAGIFRPGTSFQGPSKEITRRWLYDSYNYYDGILKSPEADLAGVYQSSGYIFSSKYPEITRNHFLEKLLPVYRKATKSELSLCNGDWKYGSYFTTVVVESGRFLPYAMGKFTSAGGSVIKSHINSFQDLNKMGQNYDAVFNCTGLGAKWLCGDEEMLPLRGQVIKVSAPWIKTFFYGDYDTYVIPGRDTVTLGGCRQLESWNTNVDKYDTSSIMERCTDLLPSLKEAKVVKELVGLRPYRSKVRCELEMVDIGNGSKTKLIHCYGHGGYGVTSAPGSTKYAVQLLKENLRGNHSSGKIISKL